MTSSPSFTFSTQENTWGIAYKVHPKDVPDVMSYLNHREKGGYTTQEVPFYPKDERAGQPSHSVLVYIGTEANSHYLGPAPTEALAEQVVMSRGPSGCNSEYVLELAKSMRHIAPLVNDKHLFALETKVKELLQLYAKDSGRIHKGHTISTVQLPKCNCHSYQKRTKSGFHSELTSSPETK